MFLLFLIKMFATHLKPKRRAAERRVGRVSGHRQVLMMAIMIGWWWWWWLVDDCLMMGMTQRQALRRSGFGSSTYCSLHVLRILSSHVQQLPSLIFQVEQTISLCPPPAAAHEGRGLRALQAQLSNNPSASQPSAPSSPEDPLPSLPPSYIEALSTPSSPLYPCAPPKYTELPEGGSTVMLRWDIIDDQSSAQSSNHSLPWWSHTRKVHQRLVRGITMYCYQTFTQILLLWWDIIINCFRSMSSIS